MSARRTIHATRRRRPHRAPLVAALVVALALAAAAAAGAQPDAVPSPTPGLTVSSKPALGCCCVSAQSPPRPQDCFSGLGEGRCKKAGEALKRGATTWSAGKCAGE